MADAAIGASRAPHHASRLLSVSGLTAGFDINGRFVPAVNKVSFSLSAGQTLCIVGESGSGKSVTAFSLIRLVPPPGRVTSGTIEFNGRDLMRLDERELQRVRGSEIGFVVQEPMTALNPVMTIGSHIEETLRVHDRATRRTARERAVELLEAVSVPEPQRRVREYPHQLSGGLRQRALIAMALACGPKLLIADEPTTALDVTIQAQILDLLRTMQKRFGLALLLITHDLGVVAEMADRVAVMYAGRIVEHSPVKELFSDPKHPYTRGLLESTPGGPRGTRLKAIQGMVPALGELPAGCSFAPRCPSRFEPCGSAHPGETVVELPAKAGSYNVGSPNSNVASPNSNVASPNSNVASPNSNVASPNSNVASPNSNVASSSFRLQAEVQRTVKCYLYGPAREEN
jgi:oligopeptide/dipeptide ABC transporter ATP-binding protein